MRDEISFQNGQLKRLIGALTAVTLIFGLVTSWPSVLEAMGVATRSYHSRDIAPIEVQLDSLQRGQRSILRVVCSDLDDVDRYTQECPD